MPPVTINGDTGIVTPMYNGSITANAVTPSVNMKNRIINGAMVISQRNGTSTVTPAAGDYTLDRYRTVANAASKFSVAQSADAPAGFVNSLLVTSLSAYSVASGDELGLQQRIEGYNISDLAWGTASAKTVTVSFWVKSSLTGNFGASLTNGSFNRWYPFSYTISAANTWEQKSVTIAGDTTGTWATNNTTGIQIEFGLGIGSTLQGTGGAWTSSVHVVPTGSTSVVGTNAATWQLTGLQLEVGSTATSFDYRPYGTELQLCQRYFERWTTADQNMVGFCYASNNLNTYSQFLVEKRAAPTLTRYGTFTAYVSGGGNTITFSAYNAATKAININWTGGGITAGQAFAWSSGGSPNQLEFSAEL